MWKCELASLIPLYGLYLYDQNLYLLSRDIFIETAFYFFICVPIDTHLEKNCMEIEGFYGNTILSTIKQ